MHWVIQNNIFREAGHERLVEALARREIPHSVHKVVPFAGVLEPECLPPPGKVVVMGSYTLARIAQERGWTPGAFVGPGLDYEVQVKHWGADMLNYGAWVGRLVDVPEQREPFFVRPTLDSKSFSGQIHDWATFEEWRERTIYEGPILAAAQPSGIRPGYVYPVGTVVSTVDSSKFKWAVEVGLPRPDLVGGKEYEVIDVDLDDLIFGPHAVDDDTRVMVCAKKEIWTETRFWIVRGKIVTASVYKVGTRTVSREAIVDLRDPVVAFAVSVALRGGMTHGERCSVPQCQVQKSGGDVVPRCDWQPHLAYCLDVADTPDGPKVIEVNNLNSAGFYAADLGKLVEAIEGL